MFIVVTGSLVEMASIFSNVLNPPTPVNKNQHLEVPKIGPQIFQSSNSSKIRQDLVGGFQHLLFVHSVGNVIIPTDFHSIIFQRGRAQPPTSVSLPVLVYNVPPPVMFVGLDSPH